MTAASFASGPHSMLTASGISMEQSSRNNTTVVGEDRTVVADRISSFLRAKHPVKTAENVAADTGISPATVARWLDRGSAPSIPQLGKLVGAYDAEVLCVILDHPPAWMVSRAREQERERLERQIATLRAQIEGAR